MRGGPGRLRPGQALRAWREAVGGGEPQCGAIPHRSATAIGGAVACVALVLQRIAIQKKGICVLQLVGVSVAVGPAAAVEPLLPAGRDPPQRSDGSRVSHVGRRAGLRAVSQSGPARSLLQVGRWLSMELALAGRGRVDVGVCSVVGWVQDVWDGWRKADAQ